MTKVFDFKKWGSTGSLVGIVGAAICAAVFSSMPKDFLASYMYAYIFWLGLSLGCLGLLTLHHTVRGSWSLSVVRIYEAGGGPIMFVMQAIMFLPILLSRGDIYHHWLHPDAADKVLQAKQWWLNEPFWLGRTVAYFAIWIILGHLLASSSQKEDKTKDTALGKKRSSVGAIGLVIFMLSVTFAITDWLMSVDPHWSSTIFGVWTAINGALAALAVGTIIVTTGALKGVEPYANVWTPNLGKDLGNMMFTFSMLWCYTTLSQYLIIWSGNLPEYITFYVNRNGDFWNAVGAFNIVVGFFICWGFLLSPRVKANANSLRSVALAILIIRATDWLWNVIPFFRVHLAWTEALAMVTLGGFWFAVMGQLMPKSATIPEHDTRLFEMAKMEAAH